MCVGDEGAGVGETPGEGADLGDQVAEPEGTDGTQVAGRAYVAVCSEAQEGYL